MIYFAVIDFDSTSPVYKDFGFEEPMVVCDYNDYKNVYLHAIIFWSHTPDFQKKDYDLKLGTEEIFNKDCKLIEVLPLFLDSNLVGGFDIISPSYKIGDVSNEKKLKKRQNGIQYGISDSVNIKIFETRCVDDINDEHQNMKQLRLGEVGIGSIDEDGKWLGSPQLVMREISYKNCEDEAENTGVETSDENMD